jgi:hypothetical protein
MLIPYKTYIEALRKIPASLPSLIRTFQGKNLPKRNFFAPKLIDMPIPPNDSCLRGVRFTTIPR